MDTPPFGLSDHVYYQGDPDFKPPSSAAASKNTGGVGVSVVLNPDNFVPEGSVEASATTWIKIDTSQPGYGSPNPNTPNVLTFTPRINWQAAIRGFGDYAWANEGATGPLDVVGWVTLVASRLDPQPSIVTTSDFQIFHFETMRLGNDQTQGDVYDYTDYTI
jgi:hypothetical protein